MPCRLPCQRYMNVDSRFEAAGEPENFDGGEYEPTVSREGYQRRVLRPPPPPMVRRVRRPMRIESYEYDPTVSNETYSDMVDSEAKCGCEPMNRPYRMESCGYNQSPTWDSHRAFQDAGVMMPPSVPSAEGFDQANNGGSCGCESKNLSYRGDQCEYNQSPTWGDQASFRNTLQDRPF